MDLRPALENKNLDGKCRNSRGSPAVQRPRRKTLPARRKAEKGEVEFSLRAREKAPVPEPQAGRNAHRFPKQEVTAIARETLRKSYAKHWTKVI